MRAPILLAMALPLAAQQVKLPPFERQTLPNGAVVLLMPRSDVPLVTVRAMIRGGQEADPADAAGLASITAELLRRGTTSRTADQFAEQVDFLGASFNASSDDHAVYAGIGCLSRFLDRAVELVADAVLRPSFPEDEVKKTIAQRVDGAKSVKDNPGAALGVYFRPFFYGSAHPYGRVSDEITLAKITREQIAGYHKRLFTGRNLTLIAVGDFEPKSLGPKLAKAFGDLPAGEAWQWVKDPSPPSRSSARLLLIDKPDATQTYFQIAQPGIHRAHPDRVGLLLVNTLFGGRFTSMLNDELRVNSGLTYGANCQLSQNRLTGAIAINTYTRTDTTAQAMDLALDVLKRLAGKGIDAEMLASAKAYVKGGFPTRTLETASQLANVLADLELYGLGRDEIDQFFARIDAVTLDQANALVKKYYRTGNLQFAVLGNAAKIREAVAKFAGSRKELSISAPGFRPPEF
jgi:zinc protease